MYIVLLTASALVSFVFSLFVCSNFSISLSIICPWVWLSLADFPGSPWLRAAQDSVATNSVPQVRPTSARLQFGHRVGLQNTDWIYWRVKSNTLASQHHSADLASARMDPSFWHQRLPLPMENGYGCAYRGTPSVMGQHLQQVASMSASMSASMGVWQTRHHVHFAQQTPVGQSRLKVEQTCPPHGATFSATQSYQPAKSEPRRHKCSFTFYWTTITVFRALTCRWKGGEESLRSFVEGVKDSSTSHCHRVHWQALCKIRIRIFISCSSWQNC